MTVRPLVPSALTIAGSDSGGGAGLQADLKTFERIRVHGMSVVTCVTAQSPGEVLGIEAVSTRIVRQQLEAVFTGLTPAACKTGMLYSAEIIRVIVQHLSNCEDDELSLIVDPVMVATSGARLLKKSAITALCDCLFPLATVVTPNLAEAELLLGRTIKDEEALREAARGLVSRYGCAALVKGGHLRGTQEAVDIFYDGRTELMLTAPFIRGVVTHGTGCTYSAAIAAYCARGVPLPKAVSRAKQYVTDAIAGSRRVGRHMALRWN